MSKPDDITGRQFHRLTALELIGRRGVHALWRCRCECGKTTQTTATSLKTGNTKSCGCLNSELLRARAPIAAAARRLKESAPLCQCGCGMLVKRGSGRWRKFVVGHCYRVRANWRGSETAHWKGGILVSAGRTYIYKPGHPRAVKGRRYVARYILILEQHTGQPVPRDMEVHHINGDKSDDRIENLQILTKSEHTRLHATGRRGRKRRSVRHNSQAL